MNPRPFRSDVSQNEIEALRQRLARTRWPDEIPASAWAYAANLSYLQELAAYWKDHFDQER